MTQPPAPAVVPQLPVAGSYRVVETVAIRSQPTSASALLGQVPAGTTVGVQCVAVGEYINDGRYIPTSDWDRVTFSGVTGYITDYVVETNNDIKLGRIPKCP